MGFRTTVENRRGWGRLPPFAIQGGSLSIEHETLPNCVDGIGMHAERLGNLRPSPGAAVATVIAEQQQPGMPDLLGRGRSVAADLVETIPLLSRQVNGILTRCGTSHP
jgi:hypothetical protein